MPSLFTQSELKDLIEKVEKGERLDFAAGVRMMDSQDILALGYMANLIRERKNGNQTFFKVNPHFNPLNVDTKLGKGPKASMLYKQGEPTLERIGHLLRFREIQDRTGRFLSFSPLPLNPETNQFLGTWGVADTTGLEDLKVLAISRILLDNIDHLKACWELLGQKLAQVSLSFGVDELDGTLVEERIIHSSESATGPVMSRRALIHMIQKAGRDAVERTG